MFVQHRLLLITFLLANIGLRTHAVEEHRHQLTEGSRCLTTDGVGRVKSNGDCTVCGRDEYFSFKLMDCKTCAGFLTNNRRNIKALCTDERSTTTIAPNIKYTQTTPTPHTSTKVSASTTPTWTPTQTSFISTTPLHTPTTSNIVSYTPTETNAIISREFKPETFDSSIGLSPVTVVVIIFGIASVAAVAVLLLYCIFIRKPSSVYSKGQQIPTFV